MNRSFYQLIGAVVLALALCGAAGGQVWEEWVARYNGPFSFQDRANALALDSDGNIYVTGPSDQGASWWDSDYLTIKYNSDGNMLWMATYNGPGNSIDISLAVALDDSDNVYIGGYSMAANYDWAVIKYSSNGEELWVVRFNGPQNLSDTGCLIAVDDSGNVYAAGSLGVASSVIDMALVKFNAQGNQQWMQSYNGPGNGYDYVHDLVIDANSDIYLTGSSRGATGNMDYVTMKYNSDGEQAWVARYTASIGYNDGAYDLELDSQGNTYVTGECAGDFVTIKYDFYGAVIWIATYGGTGTTEKARAMEIGRAGDIYVTGTAESSTQGYDFLTVKYSPDGVQQWEARYNAPGNGEDCAWAMDMDSLDNVYITGYCAITSEREGWATVKYDALGTEKWTALYCGAGVSAEWPYDIAVDENQKVYVTGQTWWQGFYYDFTTIKYNQNLPDISLAIIPFTQPIQIPASGGSFSYYLFLTNNQMNNFEMDLWCKAIAPDSSYRGPLLGPSLQGMTLGTTGWVRTQDVPASVPSGVYQYIGYAGIYPNNIWVTDTLIVEKLSTGTGPIVNNWDCTWEPLSQDEKPTANPIPSALRLSANPNPFNPATVISYKLQAASHVSLRIHDIAGRLVAELVNDWREVGEYQITFDGSGLASGIYFAKLEARNYKAVQKMMLLK